MFAAALALVAAGPALAASQPSQMSQIEQRERAITAQLNEQQVQNPGTTAPIGSSGSMTSGGSLSNSTTTDSYSTPSASH
jgi:hypothetical protein